MWFNCEHCQFIAKFGLWQLICWHHKFSGHIWNLHNTQILIVHQSFGFVHLIYSKFVLQNFIVYKFDDQFPIEFMAIVYEFLYLNITIALQIHLQDVHIRQHLSCKNPLQAREFYLKIHVKLGGSNINFHWTYLVTCDLPVIALLHKGIFGEKKGHPVSHLSSISATCSLTASPGSVFLISHIQINRWQFAVLMQQTKLRFKAGAYNYWT